MKVNYIHNFDLSTEKEFLKIQNDLKQNINISNEIKVEDIKTCAGVDIAYWEKDNKSMGACSIVIIDFKTKNILEKVFSIGEITIPYVSGFLAFRELPLVLETIKKITIEPDIFIFDGNGYLHPNNMGIATHAGFFIDKPTIGVAKTYLKIENVNFDMPKNEVGAYTDIIINNSIYGRVVRSTKDVKPIFISCGNNINLDSCYNIVMNLLSKDSRIPIPTRLADLETHILRTKYKK